MAIIKKKHTKLLLVSSNILLFHREECIEREERNRGKRKRKNIEFR